MRKRRSGGAPALLSVSTNTLPCSCQRQQTAEKVLHTQDNLVIEPFSHISSYSCLPRHYSNASFQLQCLDLNKRSCKALDLLILCLLSAQCAHEAFSTSKVTVCFQHTIQSGKRFNYLIFNAFNTVYILNLYSE